MTARFMVGTASAPSFADPSRDWSAEILTLAADLIDENGRVVVGKDEAKAIRDVLQRLDISKDSSGRPAPPAAWSFGLYLGPARITWNCLHPVRGRWNFRFIWIRGGWRCWSVSWPTPKGLRLADRMRRNRRQERRL